MTPRPPQVGVALTPDLDRDVTDVSRALGCTRTQAARHLLERGVEAMRWPPTPAVEPFEVMFPASNVAYSHLHGVTLLLHQVALSSPREAAEIALNLSRTLHDDAQQRVEALGITLDDLRASAAFDTDQEA